MTPATGDEKAGGQRVGSVVRAIELIDALAGAPEGLGVNELARRIEVNPSTASRLLATLDDGGLVRRDDRGRFQLGLKLLALADRLLTRLDVRELARPHLRALVERTGETVTLSVAIAGEAVTVDFVPGKSSVVSMAQVGRPNALHATAIGKTMLAFGPQARIPAAAELTRFTDRSIVKVGELERVVEQVREAGWAEAVAEREDDLAALAAPVFGADRRLAAVVGLQGPLARMTDSRRRELLPDVLATARAVSAELGGVE
jgi:IclR family acetate operon transcriptional repressor